VREAGLYWEAVALDAALREWRYNGRTVGVDDVVSLALGVRVVR
jgi:hypothetical protein